MDESEKLKFDQIVESFKGDQKSFDISKITIEAYPIGHLIESFGSDVYGIISPDKVAIPVNRVYINPFEHY